jgi:hypothetical protein
MAAYPEPKVGLVISYAYLWVEEAENGQVEGRKERPCAIIVALDSIGSAGKHKQVTVVPITHSPHVDPNVAVEIPQRVKQHLGLDSERSWVILDEINEFIWPGYDLRPIKGDQSRVDYGFLPPQFFDQLIEKFARLEAEGRVGSASRDL